jgi:Tol biopolymer transport system component
LGEHDPIDGGPGRLVEVRADGSGQRTIVPDQGVVFEAAVAPDGERLAFVSGDGARVETVDLRSGARKAVASTTQGFLWSPRWSPDGEWLTYVASPDEAVSELFVVRADGSGRRRISQPPEPVGEFDWRPS